MTRTPRGVREQAEGTVTSSEASIDKASGTIQQSFRSFAISDRATRSVWDDSRHTCYGIRIGEFVYRWPSWLATDTTFEESNGKASMRWLDPD